MQHIIMIIDELKGGGAQRSTARLAKLLLDHGYPVSLVILQDVVDIQIDPRTELYYLGFKKGIISYFGYRYFTYKLKQVLDGIKTKRGWSPLIIGHLGLAHNLMNRLELKDAYYTLHGTTSQAKLGNKSGSKKERKIREIQKLYNGKNIISVSDGVGQDILALGVKPKSIQTIYNPFDFEEIRALAEEKIGFDIPEKAYIVHVGRFSRVKRHDLLVEAFAALSDRSLKLVLVGKGEEEENIRKRVEALGLGDRIIFAGFQENPFPIIRHARALVLSSDNEGLPTVIVEALALGVPVVSTDCPSGPREILAPEWEGHLAEVGNRADLARKIERSLAQSPRVPPVLLLPFEQNTIIEKYKALFS